MAAYRRVYDSRQRQADCHEPGSAPEPYTYTLGNRVWAAFTFFKVKTLQRGYESSVESRWLSVCSCANSQD